METMLSPYTFVGQHTPSGSFEPILPHPDPFPAEAGDRQGRAAAAPTTRGETWASRAAARIIAENNSGDGAALSSSAAASSASSPRVSEREVRTPVTHALAAALFRSGAMRSYLCAVGADAGASWPLLARRGALAFWAERMPQDALLPLFDSCRRRQGDDEGEAEGRRDNKRKRAFDDWAFGIVAPLARRRLAMRLQIVGPEVSAGELGDDERIGLDLSGAAALRAADLLKCPVCRKCSLSTPMVESGCHHVLCEPCFHRTKENGANCPVCRASGESEFRPLGKRRRGDDDYGQGGGGGST